MKYIIFLLVTSSLVFAKGRDGNGGNEIALRFSSLGSKIVNFLEDKREPISFSLDKLKVAIKETKVFTVTYKLCPLKEDRKCLEHAGFVAKNYPETKEILINELKWQNLQFEEKVKIVLHEYLGLLGVEEGNYDFSSKLIIAMNNQNGNKYACQLALIYNKYPVQTLGQASFVVQRGDTGASMITSEIDWTKKLTKTEDFIKKYKNRAVIFRTVTGMNYLRGQIEIASLKKRRRSTTIEAIEEIVFENVTFFKSEPIGVKVFKKDDYILQVSCSHIE